MNASKPEKTTGTPEARRIAARIVARRDELGLKDIELARRMKVSRSRIHNWTSGAHEPRLASLRRLAKILKCEVSDLLGVA